MKVVNVVASIVLATAAASFLGLGLELRSGQAPYADGVVTTATMTGFRTERATDRRRKVWKTRYRPVYTFQTRTGETATCDDADIVSVTPRLGRTVELSYRTNDPGGSARVIRGWHGWTGLPIMFTVGGGLFLAVIVVMSARDVVRYRANRRS
ncbi:DUF3592 domain-containing protein [Actinoplanes flavus]|uniref:DUF3592 domain-containing protein n=1 Tax=Actinoplanes flavus TaxID=2820290 RepID=A0ABS3UG63_9ACTN|nr:DUF3592 domain-containing protein [Actinoplanes flavus]MBO3737767.1 DUF3592 domain-containing protein [Actinoplanes flavus]